MVKPVIAVQGQVTAERSRAVRPRANDPMKPNALAPDAKPSVLRAWKKRFQCFYDSHFMNEMPVKEQQIHFLSCLTTRLEARMNDVIHENTPVVPTSGQPTSCLELLEEEFLITHPLVNRRHDFFCCAQSHNEKLTDFMIRLVELAQEADLESLGKDELILFQGLSGTNDREFQQNFLRGETHTLAKLKKMAQTYVTAQSSVRGLKDSSKFQKVNQQGSGKKAAGQNTPKPQQQQQNSPKLCWRCRKPISGQHTPNNCYHRNSKCFKCGEVGHALSACKKGETKAKVRTAEGDESALSEESSPADESTQGESNSAKFKAIKAVDLARSRGEFAKTSLIKSDGKVVKIANPNNRPTPKMQVTVAKLNNGQPIDSAALPDSGATQSIVSQNMVEAAQLRVNPHGAIPIIAADGLELKCEGSAEINLTYEDVTAKVTALVSPTVEDEMIVSWHDLIDIGVLHPEFPKRIRIPHETVKAAAEVLLTKSAEPLYTSEDGKISLEELLTDYKDVLKNSLEDRKKEIVGGPMTIHLTEDQFIKPMHVTTTKPIPRHWQKMADDLVAELIKSGTIVPETEPTKWINKGFFVAKPHNQNALRLVTNLQKLNLYTKRPIHPFPTPQAIRQNLDSDSKVFCTMDATHGYF